MNDDTEEKKEIRCAIYTRKSTTEGLGGDFTSLDNQRESAESYIQSQKSQGWLALPDSYNDGGFTGSNVDRPALQKLIEDIKSKKVNCVVVYKVDRLSRSLIDFVKLLQFFEENKVTFVSVTQHFDTNSSMGRLTLNILLSFAQFEREIISERTKDKMGAARRRGKWTGGPPPLGYDIDKVNKKIIINPKEAETVRVIFDLYVQERSLLKVAQRLNEKGFTTKCYIRKGKPSGAVRFKNTNVQLIIRNWTYAGKVSYQGQVYPGLHRPIISEEHFREVNELLSNNRRERGTSKNKKSVGLLSGLLRCKDCGVAMCHTYSQKGKIRYLYYVCLNALKRDRRDCPTKTVSADKLEVLVLTILRNVYQDPRLEATTWDQVPIEKRVKVIGSLLKEADYSAKQAILGLVFTKGNERREFKVELRDLKHIRVPKKEAIKNEPKLRQNLALAHQIEELLHSGKINDLKQLTGHLHMSHARINQLMAMTLLSPAIQEDILLLENERLSTIPEYKLREITGEPIWKKQQALWHNLLQPPPSREFLQRIY